MGGAAEGRLGTAGGGATPFPAPGRCRRCQRRAHGCREQSRKPAIAYVDLGRLDEAAAAYEEGIKRFGKRDDRRGVSTAKFQLGTVWLFQQRYVEALEIYAEARDTFAALGEPRQVARVWHQIGRVHEAAGQFEPAEQAYRQSLAIKVRENDLAGQAPSLNQLGNLYDAMGRLEETVTFYRQAAEFMYS